MDTCIFRGHDIYDFDGLYCDAAVRRLRLDREAAQESLEDDGWTEDANEICLDGRHIVFFKKIGKHIFCSAPSAFCDDLELLEPLILQFYKGSRGPGWRRIGQIGGFGYETCGRGGDMNVGWSAKEPSGPVTYVYGRG